MDTRPIAVWAETASNTHGERFGVLRHGARDGREIATDLQLDEARRLYPEYEIREACPFCKGDAIPGTTCPRSIVCPTCDAGPGQSCKRPSGHRASSLHAARVTEAEQIDSIADGAIAALTLLGAEADAADADRLDEAIAAQTGRHPADPMPEDGPMTSAEIAESFAAAAADERAHVEQPIGESIAADLRQYPDTRPAAMHAAIMGRIDETRRYIEGDTLDERCTGYVDERGYLAHDGPTCPVHESGDNDPGDETETYAETITARVSVALDTADGPIETRHALARVLLECADSPLDDEKHASTLEKLFAPGQRVDELDDDDLAELRSLVEEEHARRRHYAWEAYHRAGGPAPTPEPANLEEAAGELRDAGRRIEHVREALEAAGQLEPGRSMVGDLIGASLDQLDEAIAALGADDNG